MLLLLLLLDFGDELALESFKISWLIWIQLVVLILLVLFLFCFINASDPSSSHHTAPPASSSSSSSSSASTTIQSFANHHYSTPVTLTNPLHITRGVENLSIKGEIVPIVERTEIVREDIAEGKEASSLYFLHPCYYFRIARVAFLKCLGLDSTSESDNSPNQKHGKQRKQS